MCRLKGQWDDIVVPIVTKVILLKYSFDQIWGGFTNFKADVALTISKAIILCLMMTLQK